MKKRYFMSYAGLNRSNDWVLGHLTVETTDTSLAVLAKRIAEHHGFTNAATILCLKDLSKKEYRMLSGLSGKD